MIQQSHYRTKTISILLSGAILFASCASTTMIQSNPSGAKVYVNGEPAGNTPYAYRDTKIVGSITTFKIEKDGYAPLIASISRDEQVDVGAVIGGIFFLFPFLWTMKYKDSHTFDLVPSSGVAKDSIKSPVENKASESKADRLRELKSLLDDNILNQEEYDKEKKKILEEDEN